MGRIDAGISLLDSHPDLYNPVVKPENVMGKISNVRFENKTMIGTVTLGAQCSDATRADLESGILDMFSVGYCIYKGIREEDTVTNTVTYKMTDWEPNHVAIAPIPADINSTMRSNDQKNTFFIENNLKNEKNMFKTIEEIRAGGTAEEKSRIEGIVSICRSAQLDDVRAMELFGSEKTLDAIRSENPVKVIDTPVNVEEIRSQTVGDRKIRLDSILKSTRPAGIEDSRAIEFFNSDKPLEDIRQTVLEEFVRGNPKPAPHLGEEPIDKKVRAVEGVLLGRIDPKVFAKEAAFGVDYRGMSLIEMGKEILTEAGVNVRGKDKTQIAKLMIAGDRSMSTSDFPLLLENVANKALRGEYVQSPEFWNLISRETSVSDFRAKSLYQIGGKNKMSELPEGSELKYGALVEAKQTIKVKSYGEGLLFTRQMIINDDLGAFQLIPQKFIRDWNLLRGDLVWGMITGNIKMGDGKELFHADHKNLEATTKGIISGTTLKPALVAIKNQKDIDGVTKIRVMPRYLIVSPDYEIEALQLLTAVIATAATDVNIYATLGLTLIVEPRLSGKAWYLCADPNATESLYHAYLDGNGGLRSNREDDFSTDSVKLAVRGEFGVQAIDYRGWYKNPGE